MENILAYYSGPVYTKTKPLHICPDCKSPLQRRVSRGWLVKNVFFWLYAKRYRCDKCFRYVYVKNDKRGIEVSAMSHQLYADFYAIKEAFLLLNCFYLKNPDFFNSSSMAICMFKASALAAFAKSRPDEA